MARPLILFLLVGVTASLPAALHTEVTRLDAARRETVLNYRAFGGAGHYEKLVGTVHFALDPQRPANAGIVDLELARRNADGLVEFSADFYLLKPVDPAKGNGRLLSRQSGLEEHPGHVPEGRALDGAFDQMGCAGRGSFNHRFGQQSRDQLQHFNRSSSAICCPRMSRTSSLGQVRITIGRRADDS